MPITVVSIDDHPLIRAAVRTLLDPKENIRLLAEGSVGQHVWPLVERYRPNVLMLDIGMPLTEDTTSDQRFSPLQTVTKLHREYPETAVMFLTQYTYPLIIQRAVELGVRGYLLKSDDLSLELPVAVETIHRGGVYFSREISSLLFRPGNATLAPFLLSHRQKEIILAIAKAPDLPYQQIAYNLSITDSTLKGHLHKAFKALNVSNITACIIACMQQGLIPFTIDESGGIHFGSLVEIDPS